MRWLVAFAAVVVGVAARFVAASPMWLDEALSADISALPVGDIGDALRHDGHPPLYYMVLHGWQQVFGDSDFALRALSGVFGVATLAMTFVVARRLRDTGVAVIAVAVVASSPFYVRYATEARMYALIMFLVTLGWWLFDMALDDPRLRRLAGVTAVVAAAAWTHYWAFFLLAVVGIALVWRVIRGDRSDPARRVLMAMAVGGLTFLPWVSAFLYQRAHTGTPWAPAARPTVVAAETLLVFAGQAAAEPYLLLTLLAAAGVLAFVAVVGTSIGLRAEGDVRVAGAIAVSTVLLGAVVSIAAGSAFQGRYAAWVAPFVMFIVAVGLDRLVEDWLKTLGVAAIVGLGFLGVAHDIDDDRSQSLTFANEINEGWTDGDLVVFCPDQLAPAAVRYLDDDVEHVTYPTFSSSTRVDWADYVDRHAQADPAAFASGLLDRVAPGSRVWFVSSDSYRAVGEQCSAVAAAMAPSTTSELSVRADAIGFFEHGNLIVLSVT